MAVLSFLLIGLTFGATAQSFRSKATGNWNAISSWEMSTNGNSWSAATSTPTSANGAITIRTGHTITVTAAVTIDETTVASGGTLVSQNAGITVANGTGTDLTVAAGGTFRLGQNDGSTTILSRGILTIQTGSAVSILGSLHANGSAALATSITNSGSISFGSTGSYTHYYTDVAGTIPTATWSPTSTMTISGYTSGTGTVTGFNQAFGHIVINCPNLTGTSTTSQDINYNLLGEGQSASAAGNLTITRTGTGVICLSASTASTTFSVGGSVYQTGGYFMATTGANTDEALAMTVGGNFEISGGNFQGADDYTGMNMSVAGSYIQTGTSSVEMSSAKQKGNRYNVSTWSIYGSFILNSGTFDLASIKTNFVTAGLNLYGDASFIGGQLQRGNTLPQSVATIKFLGNTVQNLVCGATLFGKINFVVGDGTTTTMLNMADQVISADNLGTFTVNDNAGLMIGSPQGISSSGATGNVQAQGLRTFSANATYIYTGTAAQITGTGLPASVRNVTISNTSSTGVSLVANITVNNALTFTSGRLITGIYRVIMPQGSVVSGAGAGSYVYGSLQKYVAAGANSAVTFQVGNSTNYTPVTMTFPNVTTAGSYIAKVTNGDQPQIGSSCLNASKSVNSYWTLTNLGVAPATYTGAFSFTAADMDAGANYANFRVGRYNVAWTYPSITSAGLTTIVTGNMSNSGDYAIGEAAVPVVTVSADPGTTICPGTMVTFSSSVVNGGTQITYQWKKNNVNVGLNQATYSTTTLAEGDVISLSVTSTNSCGLTSTVPASTASILYATTSTWTAGSTVNKRDWFDATNWTHCVPTSSINAIIPAGLTQYPLITTGTATCLNLNIQGNMEMTGGTFELFGNFNRSTGVFTNTGGGFNMKSSGIQTVSGATFNNLTVSGGGTATLAGNVTVNSMMTMTSGQMNTMEYKLFLGPTASVSELETSYITGSVQITRTVAANTQQTFGNIGLSVTPVSGSLLPGSTTVIRVTGNPQTNINGGGVSIARYFDITATNTTGMNLQMVFSYFTHELNNIATSDLTVFKSIDGGAYWMPRYYTSRDAGNKTVTLNEVGGFSRWTLGSSANPLPVELRSFTAVRHGHDALLTWVTASETDNNGFDVEVSADGNEFRTLATVKGAATTSQQQTYTFRDTEKGKSGVRYYRLRQVDFDGTSTVFGSKAVRFGELNSSVVVSPMPFRQQLSVQLVADAAGTANLQLIDALGRIVMQQNQGVSEGLNLFDLSPAQQLATGMYVLHVRLNGETFQIRLVNE